MLNCLKYRTLQHETTALEKFLYGVVFMLTYGISLLVMVTSTQILKYLIKRTRPDALSHTKRIGNLRKAEEGTYSMPSGDSAAASLFCFLFATVVGLPALYVILPLVMCGRVYY